MSGPTVEEGLQQHGYRGVSRYQPDDIESISVLKGPTQLLYTVRGSSNGVLLITTKRAVPGEGSAFRSTPTLLFDSPMFLPIIRMNTARATQGNVLALSVN